MRRPSCFCCALLLLTAQAAACQPAPERPARAPTQLPPAALRAVRSWAYQIDGVDPAAIAASDFELVVVDYARDGSDETTAFTAADVAAMQRRRDGTRRLVLAQLNIGEAEDHRAYWQRAWATRPPAWLGAEHADSRGSYTVRFWDPAWQRIIFGAPNAYLDKILRAGFDGVYLDLVDAYESHVRTRPQAEREMVAFVRDLSRYAKAYAKARRGAFFVFAQNAEPLVAHGEYLAAVDGLGKEGLFYGYDDSNAFTPRDETEFSLEHLGRARDAGKLVLTVDYASDAAVVAQVYRRARAQGFVPYATTRDLDRLTVHRGLDSVRQGTPTSARRLLPGQFFAITAPPGVVRTSISADAWRESADDEVAGGRGAGASRREWTYAATLGYGLPGGWEVGASVPVVSARLDGDGGSGTRGTGLGNIALLASRGWSWSDGDRNLLATIEAAVPTDTRASDLRSGGEARLSLTGERYRGRLGVIASVGAGAVAAGGGLADPEAALEGSVGVGLQAHERLFAAAHLSGDRSAARVTTEAELLLARDASVELFVGRDLSGAARASFFGVALNYSRDTGRGRRTAR
jgi:cysteinyl-tRNA synthetase